MYKMASLVSQHNNPPPKNSKNSIDTTGALPLPDKATKAR